MAFESGASRPPGAMSRPPRRLRRSCTHDGADLLRDALESLTFQSIARDRFEVVVVDDGSTDHTGAVCAELSGRLPLRYVRIANSGIAAAKNAGIRAARGAVTGRRAEIGVPEQVIPMRMRRKPCHYGLAQLAEVVREAGHFGAVHPGVDEQHASPAVHDNGVALAELALVDQHALRDLPQHGWLLPLVVCNRLLRR